MRMIVTAAVAALMLTGADAPASAEAKPVAGPADLTRFNVTVRRFDIVEGLGSGIDFVLPVDSPDAEHACASTLANASAFSRKVENGKPLPLAFTCVKIEKR